MKKTILIGVLLALCVSSTATFCQNQWKSIQKVMKGANTEFKLDSARSDSIVKYVSLSKLDSCISNDTNTYQCWFGGFYVEYQYKPKSHEAYVVLKKEKTEYALWMYKKYGLELMGILKQKCTLVKGMQQDMLYKKIVQ
jgi:hypothetical protein